MARPAATANHQKLRPRSMRRISASTRLSARERGAHVASATRRRQGMAVAPAAVREAVLAVMATAEVGAVTRTVPSSDAT